MGIISEHALKFLTTFKKLKSVMDDRPDELVSSAEQDESIMALCGEVLGSAMILRSVEARVSKGYIRPVNQEFISEWRDYERRYAELIDHAYFLSLFSDLEERPRIKKSRAEIQWENADEEAAEAASAIDTAIEFAQFNIEQTERHSALGFDHVEDVELGLRSWEDLLQSTQTDVRGILRRRRLLPIVLVPKKISDRIGANNKLSILTSLEQAQRSFIYGQNLAVIALLRSVVEITLRDAYEFRGADLEAMIDNGATKLTKLGNAANAARLHRLRKDANAILHHSTDPFDRKNGADGMKAELEVLSFLFSVRDLVEGAK